ncbi:hypothetical protein GCM10011414_17040 [Croceivirga lutea]|uniref:YdeI/OmpD-associated family protein n=1 Tax=Croceivirga lutea TaxID=1775167 RepID=UPI0016396C86|nr:YdeI/OmpD-associated family protein [Croceivirga lutea]GGG47905.1 hypothetical protein GCM10011414_17040 [Croceivirga lutea]
MKSSVFEVSLQGSHTIVLPENIINPFLEKGQKRVVVKAIYENKELTFHAAITKYHGNYIMMFSKAKQKELGVFLNDYFQLQFFEDTSKYGVEVPEEFEAVLMSDYEAYQIFEELTKGKQRSIIYAISRHKNAQTRIDKTIIVCENLKRGIRDNKDLFKTF